ncbi:MAG TPA: c-type cytochrome [Steroidobacteraceae bacterium]|jgi:cytochrome c553|nr:c-type cytochrome [Steroidobacteraceae bacterium]
MEATTMKRCLVSLSGAILLGLQMAHAAEIDAVNRAAGERVAIGTCATCHGPQGHSYSPKFPVLAGQHANYLVAQLQAFKAQTRGDPDALGYMWGMAAPLGDGLMASLADYYSRQVPVAGPTGAAALITRGKDIYQKGDSAAGVPPCAACHGAAAAGTDDFPRLAGQHVQYLIKQLRSFQNNMRNVAVMHGVAQGLHLDDMEAVATYLQSLGP